MSELPDDLYMIGEADGYASSETLEVLHVPAKERRIHTWSIEEYEVLDAIQDAGYHAIREHFDWYTTDIPVSLNGAYSLPDGRVLQSKGTLLTLLTDEELQQKAIDAFDARLAERERNAHARR